MSYYERDDQIDRLRDLLDEHNRESVSLIQLFGMSEVFDPHIRRYEHNGDMAVVLLGPKDDLQGILRENHEEGTTTLEFTWPTIGRTGIGS